MFGYLKDLKDCSHTSKRYHIQNSTRNKKEKERKKERKKIKTLDVS